MFNFGTTVKRVKEENPFDSQMVVIMNAAKGDGSNRKFTFSKLAGETLEFHKNTQESDVPPVYINTAISTAVESDNGIDATANQSEPLANLAKILPFDPEETVGETG